MIDIIKKPIIWMFCDFNNFLAVVEFVYYITFCVLTWLLFKYAKKTYLHQTKQESRLFCKMFVPDTEHGKIEQLLYLEIYNAGNIVAENIQVEYSGKKLALIEFIKPGESYKLVFGHIARMIGCNRIYLQDAEVHPNETLTLMVGGNEIFVDTTVAFLHSDIIHDTDHSLTSELHTLNDTMKKAFDCRYVGPGHSSFRDELQHIAEEISKKK